MTMKREGVRAGSEISRSNSELRPRSRALSVENWVLGTFCVWSLKKLVGA